MPSRTIDFAERRRQRRLPPPDLDLPREQRLRRPPRDPDEDYALTRVVLAKRDLYLKSGKLEVIGPRHYRFHLGQEKILEYLGREGRP